jgi:hypothetical protein
MKKPKWLEYIAGIDSFETQNHLLARCTTMTEDEDNAALGAGLSNWQEQPQAVPCVIFALQLGTNTAAHRLIS